MNYLHLSGLVLILTPCLFPAIITTVSSITENYRFYRIKNKEWFIISNNEIDTLIEAIMEWDHAKQIHRKWNGQVFVLYPEFQPNKIPIISYISEPGVGINDGISLIMINNRQYQINHRTFCILNKNLTIIKNNQRKKIEQEILERLSK